LSTRSLINPATEPSEALLLFSETLEAMAADIRKLATPAPAVSDRDPRFSVEDIAHRLGVNPGVVRDRCRSGKLPAMRAGKEWRISEAGLQSYIRRCTRESAKA
jgi:excisionase family DNA binding protein